MASSTARLRNRSRAPEEYVRRAADDDLDALLSIPQDLPRLADPVEPPPASSPGAEDPRDPPSVGLPDGEQGSGQEAAGPDLSRFTPRDRTRGLSAALPNDLDVALAAYELDEARAGRRRTRIAIVEEAIERLPDDLDRLVALVASVAPCLDPDAPSRGFSVRVRPEVVEHLEHLALRLYRDRGLRRVTHRALAIAALSQLLHTQPVRTPAGTEP
jgi:predicted transcriptional regulator